MGEKYRIKRAPRPLSPSAYVPVLAGGHGGYGVTPALIKATGGVAQAQAAMAANGTPVSADALARWAATASRAPDPVKVPGVKAPRINSPVSIARDAAREADFSTRQVRHAAARQAFAADIAAFTTSGGTAPGAGTSPTAIVTRLYAELLGRLPDTEGLAYWVNQLNQGRSEAYVRAEMKKSAEYQARNPGAAGGFLDITDGGNRPPLVLLAAAAAALYFLAR